ncbi:MAG: ScpA family protein, partial [Pseudomonadota bacterium]
MQDQSFDHFDTMPGEPQQENALVLSLEGYDGPLDLLLHLARQQKVDLAKISILALAEQYLHFVYSVQSLDLAAEYLVMAAWLAYLKSKLLLPDADTDEEPESAQEMAMRLQMQLQRLDAFRKAQSALLALPQLGSERLARGTASSMRITKVTTYDNGIGDLLQAYSLLGARVQHQTLQVKPQQIMSMESA